MPRCTPCTAPTAPTPVPLSLAACSSTRYGRVPVLYRVALFCTVLYCTVLYFHTRYFRTRYGGVLLCRPIQQAPYCFVSSPERRFGDILKCCCDIVMCCCALPVGVQVKLQLSKLLSNFYEGWMKVRGEGGRHVAQCHTMPSHVRTSIVTVWHWY